MIKLGSIITYAGNDLDTLSRPFPVLLVFLRHFGCIFCRESLSDIADRKQKILDNKINLVFVHMTEPQTAVKYFQEYEFENFDHIPDPESRMYRRFGLGKGTLTQLFGLKTWVRGYKLNKSDEYNLSTKSVGDNLQMPGVFLLHKGQVVEKFIHNSIADKPDYDKLIHYSFE